MKSIYVFLFLSLFLASGCKYFKKSRAKEVDTIKADTSTRGIDTVAYFAGNNATENQAAVTENPRKDAVQGRYYMIVGCFTVPANADNYVAKLKTQGFDAQIIPGVSNYQMVAVRSYGNLKEGVAEIEKFRSEVMPEAWVYKKR